MIYLVYGIKQLLTLKGNNSPRKGKDLSELSIINNGAILIDGENIIAVGREKDIIKNPLVKKAKSIKAQGIVLPSFVDSHTHSVFAEPRLKDFSMRTSGLSYQEIKEKGGGIISSVKALRRTKKEKLLENLLYFCNKFIENGTGNIEVKSGYGLDLKNEIKILEVIKEARTKTAIEIVPTFLGAHSIPPEFKTSKEYIDYLIYKVLPVVSDKKLAVFADIFCEKGYFSYEESERYLKKCHEYGLIPKIHAEQLSKFGGSIAAYKVNAISADHMDWADDEYIKLIKKSNTIVTFLPASNYFLGLSHYPDSRKFIENGISVAIATDFNPGTSPCYNMQFVISCAVTHMKMKIEEAISASTINGAFALKLADKFGSIEKGKIANISIFDINDYREIAYYFGSNLNKMTMLRGEIVYEKENCAF